MTDLPPIPGSKHPCQYSKEVLVIIEKLLEPSECVYDPFAGTGVRLGALCDRIGCGFSGGDIEDWPGRDTHVGIKDALDPSSYPESPFTVVTSPVYLNKRLADYANGPLPTTNIKGRRDYGISLGRALDAGNLARHTGKVSRSGRYWELHGRVVANWGHRVLLNVDEPIANGWAGLLQAHGYTIDLVVPAFTQRYGGLDNADKRAEHEVVMVASR